MIFVFLFALLSCKETKTEETVSTYFYFDEPQPINDSQLKVIPSKYRGVYTYQNMQKHIEKECIYDSYREEWKLAKITLDSFKDNISYKGDMIVFRINNYNEEYNYKDEGDSLYLYRWRNDTIFSLSSTQKAKRINGQLVLSAKGSLYWQVKMLSIKKDTLYWKYFTSYEDYIALKPLVKDIRINEDSTEVHVKPTRREFAKILSLDSMAVTKYKKIK